MSNLSIARAGRFVLDLVYPPACSLCGEGGAFLCNACEAGLPRADGNRCPRCWLPLHTPHCDPAPSFRAMRSRYRYQDEVRKLVHNLKFGHQSSLAEPLGALIANEIANAGLEADALVPVPLHWRRLWARRFNQSASLAQAVSAATSVPVLHTALKRVKPTAHQVGLSQAERASNVQGAFRVPDEGKAAIAGRRLMLMDDVLTSGATVEACTRALLRAGAANVDVLVFARVVAAARSPI